MRFVAPQEKPFSQKFGIILRNFEENLHSGFWIKNEEKLHSEDF